MITLEKFPEIFWQNRKVIWDLRQRPHYGGEWVILPSDHLDDATLAALRARANAKYIGVVSSGADIEVESPREFLGELASEFYQNPSRHLTVLAITGTNGKTTCAALVRTMLVASGLKTAEIGTLGVRLWEPGKPEAILHLESGYTTPDAPLLQNLFAQLAAVGFLHVVMEASSHAIALGRLAGIDFDAALFTNLSQDHLDFHGTLAAYEEAKAALFLRIMPKIKSGKKKFAIINSLDAAGARIANALPPEVSGIWFNAKTTFRVTQQSIRGTAVQLDGGPSISSRMVGNYNAENMVGSWLLASTVREFSPKAALEAVAQFSGAKGRLEPVEAPGSSKHVFVDFAHSPDALEKALGAVRPFMEAASKLWLVFGCGGDRDPLKRPIMGEIAARLADNIVITSDNPRNESPEAIIRQIFAGVGHEYQAKVKQLTDRGAALRWAIENMAAGDVCLVAGKGHEEYQIIHGQKLPFSDQKLSAEILRDNP